MHFLYKEKDFYISLHACALLMGIMSCKKLFYLDSHIYFNKVSKFYLVFSETG